MDDPIHRPLVGLGVVRTPNGPDEIEEFDSTFSAVEINFPLGPITLTGPTTVRTFGKTGNTTGTFDTEIVSMSLTGNTPLGLITVQQDPGRPSQGQTTITDIGGGLFHIESFFDVFTELSPDGGHTWIPSDSSTHMVLEPEPATLAILALGVIPVLARRRR